MIIEDVWNTIFKFLNEMPLTFLAVIFALFVERIGNELEKSRLNFPYSKPDNAFKHMINFLIRIIFGFIIAFLFFFLMFMIIAVISAAIGLIINYFSA